MSHYRNQLEDWLKTIDVGYGKVVDIGGASNPITKRVKLYNPESHHFIDNEIEESADDIFVNQHADIENREAIEELKRIEFYDIAFCLEVFEYILDPKAAIRNIRSLLRKDGILYVTFPFVYPFHNPKQYDYLRYTPRAVEVLLKNAGFVIEEMVYRTDKSGLLASFYKNDGMHVAGHSNVTGVMVKARRI